VQNEVAQTYATHFPHSWQARASSLFNNYSYSIDANGTYIFQNGYYYNVGPGRGIAFTNWPQSAQTRTTTPRPFEGPWWIPVGTGGYYSAVNPFPGQSYHTSGLVEGQFNVNAGENTHRGFTFEDNLAGQA